MRIATAGLLLAMVAAPVCADDLAYRWNLADLYPDVAAWNADAVRLQAQLKELSGCDGQLGDSRARFKTCLDLQADAALDAEYLLRVLARRRGPIKPVLLDQRVIAGLGNIYAAESLWHARISPLSRISRTRAGSGPGSGRSCLHVPASRAHCSA